MLARSGCLQVQKIHNIIGTPPPALLAKWRKFSANMTLEFPPQQVGAGASRGRGRRALLAVLSNQAAARGAAGAGAVRSSQAA
jgi:hypothetical protein